MNLAKKAEIDTKIYTHISDAMSPSEQVERGDNNRKKGYESNEIFVSIQKMGKQSIIVVFKIRSSNENKKENRSRVNTDFYNSLCVICSNLENWNGD